MMLKYEAFRNPDLYLLSNEEIKRYLNNIYFKID